LARISSGLADRSKPSEQPLATWAPTMPERRSHTKAINPLTEKIVGFRFYRRLRVAPGVTLNLGKRNVSLSLGGRGAHLTFGTKGNRATVGLPGTGMYWTEKIGAPTARVSAPPPVLPSAAPPAPPPVSVGVSQRRIVWVIGILLGLAALIAMIH